MSGLSPEARELFRSARAEFEPDEENIGALRVAIAGSLGAGAGLAGSAHGSGGATATGLAGGAGAKVLGAILLAAAIGGGMAWGARRARSPAPGGTLVVAAKARPLATDSAAWAPLLRDPPPVVAAAPVPTPAAGPSMAAIAAGAPPELPVESLPPSPHVADGVPPTRAHRARAGTVRIAVDGSRNDAPPSIAAPGAIASDPEAAPIPAPTDTSLAEEIRILRDAQAALDRGDPQGALALVHQHELLYPTGTLEEERLVLRVMALCALARPEAAREVARQIRRAAPNSPHLAGIRASCVGTRYSE